jgi:hypothetical protein
MSTQLPFPAFAALAMLLGVAAVLRLSFPRRMEHDSADDSNEHQANSAEYQVCPCSEAHQTGSERLIAGRRQEVQCAVGECSEVK